MNSNHLKKKIFTFVKNTILTYPYKLGFIHYCSFILTAYFLSRFQLHNGIHPFTRSFGSFAVILYSFFTQYILIQTISLLTFRAKSARSVFFGLYFILYFIVNSYHLRAHTLLDLSLVVYNLSIGFTVESLKVIISSFPMSHLYTLLILIPVLIILQIKTKAFHYPKIKQTANTRTHTIFTVLLFVIILISPFKTNDDLSHIFQNAIRSAIHNPMRGILINGYPYIRNGIGKSIEVPPKQKPNILLIQIESFNANYVSKKNSNGNFITPEFNALIPKGLYFENFYGDSIQTSKGQAATLLSVIPSFQQKIFTAYPDLKIHAFPSILRDSGYSTFFIQGGESLSFDNTNEFMHRSGFTDVHSAFEFMSPSDISKLWGWGPEDKDLYKIAFSQIDKVLANKPNKPIFAMIATIANHMPFDKVPPEKRFIYPNPKNFEELYSNSIRLTDMGFPALMNEIAKRPALANTVIIISADHSFPANEHGSTHNERGFYNENFKIPLLVIWNGHIAPEKVSGSFSQVDIAPSILDIAGLDSERNHFIGSSFFAQSVNPNPVYLIQPYNGRYVGVVKDNYKYIFHAEDGNEFLFNLKDDPEEKKNLALDNKNKELLILRPFLKYIYTNQVILDTNHLWDK